MRVLLVAPHFSEYVSELAAELASSVDLLVGLDAANAEAELSEMKKRVLGRSGYRIFRFRSSSFGFRLAAVIILMARAAIFRPDIIHIQESGNKLVLLAGFFLRAFAPLVLTVHDPLPHIGRDATSLRSWKSRLKLRNSSALCFTHGDFCRKELESLQAGAVSRIRSVYHGPIMIPLSKQKRAPCSRQLLFFGRMEEYKGVETLVEACELLEAKNVDFKMTIAGSGPELERLKARLAALRSVEVQSDWLDPEAAIELFQRASLALLPYLEATQSGVLAAALANGRGVIASRVGGLPEIVEASRAGMLVPPRDPQALADAIQHHIQSPQRAEVWGAAANYFVGTEMSWHSVASKTFAGYQEVVNIS